MAAMSVQGSEMPSSDCALALRIGSTCAGVEAVFGASDLAHPVRATSIRIAIEVWRTMTSLVDAFLASDTPLVAPVETIFQGPIADALQGGEGGVEPYYLLVPG